MPSKLADAQRSAAIGGARSPGGELDSALLKELARSALLEDGAFQDVTTSATVEPEQQGRATVLVKAEGVIAGLPVMAAVFATVDLALLLERGDFRHVEYVTQVHAAVGQ